MTAPTEGAPRRRRVAVVAACVVAVGTLAVILLFGYRPLPDFPQLTEAPLDGLTGTVAWVDVERSDPDALPSSWCVRAVPAAGGPSTEVMCDDGDLRNVDLVAFDELGRLVVGTQGIDGGVQVVDLASGEVTRADQPSYRPPSSADVCRGPIGAGVEIDDDEGHIQVVVHDGADRRVALEVEGPRDYQMWCIQWMPDRRGLLLQDDQGRLLLLDVETSEARVVGDDSMMVAVTDAEPLGG